MVQASKPRLSDNLTGRQRPTAASGRAFTQSEVGSIIVIVGDVIRKETPQVLLVQNNDVCASSLLETHSERCMCAGYGRYPQTWRLLHQRSGRAASGAFAESDELLPLRSSTQPPMAISGGPVVTVVQASKPRPSDNPTGRQRRTAASGRVLCPIRDAFDRSDSRRCNRKGDAAGDARSEQ